MVRHAPPKRTAATPRTVCTPKSQLAESQHGAVGAQLKRLKLTGRELKHHFAAFDAESRLLERVYYKGKNQHRAAVFWQRFVEIRKYAARLAGMHLDETVERLRVAFFGEAAELNPKLLKTSWSHYPTGPMILHTFERCSSATLLLDKALERIKSAYHLFTLAMESAYFLQLLLTMAGLVSRLHAVLIDIRPHLVATCEVCSALMGTLHPTTPVNMALPRLARAEVLDALTMPAMCPVIQENIVHEDTGASVARILASNVANPDLLVVATGPMVSCSLSSLADTVIEDEDDVITAEQITVHRPVGIAAPASAGQGTATVASAAAIVVKTKTASRHVSTAAASGAARPSLAQDAKPKKKKKAQARDAIDDIFGF